MTPTISSLGKDENEDESFEDFGLPLCPDDFGWVYERLNKEESTNNGDDMKLIRNLFGASKEQILADASKALNKEEDVQIEINLTDPPEYYDDEMESDWIKFERDSLRQSCLHTAYRVASSMQKLEEIANMVLCASTTLRLSFEDEKVNGDWALEEIEQLAKEFGYERDSLQSELLYMSDLYSEATILNPRSQGLDQWAFPVIKDSDISDIIEVLPPLTTEYDNVLLDIFFPNMFGE